MRLSADDKWKNVSDYCRSKGVQRTKEQCKVKWDNMMPDYRKVRDYEEQKEASAPSYFEMDVWERRMKLLPSNMDAEIYYRIASIQASKPTKGGIKREAREKRPFELTHILNQSPQSMGWLGNGNEGASPAEFRGQRPLLADLVGQHVASSSQKRRRRRRAVDLSFQLERKPESMNRIDLQMDPVARPDLEIHDDSSTEDDAAVVNSRSQQGTPSVACVYADRSSFIPSHQQVNHENRLPVAYRSQNIPQQAASVIVERGNSSSATLEGAATKVACPKDTNSNTPDQSILNHVEDRKDARHRELIALEKEKLAVFREANIAIANAMTNAMSVFAKVAEELFLRHR
ncbi:hypothetical protein KP509_25G040300 [Ceratopteris richardii]|nr:hypothetical protein KP509_25G040300 [Ceratopteris richardii]